MPPAAGPLNLVTVKEADFGQGLDQQSPPNQLKDSFVEEALNADPQPTGGMFKRKGYQGFAGNLPVRIKEVLGKTGTNTLEFILDPSIDLSSIRDTPIIVRGRLGNALATGDFTSVGDTVVYYPHINTDARIDFLSGTGHTLLLPAAETALTSAAIWTGVTASTSEVDSSNSTFTPNSISINKSNFNVSIDYDNGTGSPIRGFVYFKDQSTNLPTAYFGDNAGNSGTTAVLPNGGSTTYTISQAAHGLSASTIITKVFQDDGTNYVEILPDSIVINKTTAQVQVSLTNNTGSPLNIIFSLSVAPTANFVTGAVASGTTQTVSIDLTAYTHFTFFTFTACYLDNGTVLTQVLPDSISIDATAKTMDIVFTDSGSGGGNFSIYWEFSNVTSDILKVTSSLPITLDFADTAPQLTLWGLDHTEIYSSMAARPGWTNFIDSYRSPGEERIISGLGGNLYSAKEQFEAESDLLMPTFSANLQGIIATDTIIGPALWETGQTPARTRGYITADNGATNFFEIDSISWDSGLLLTKIVLDAPNLAIHGTLSTIISTSGLRDKLRVEGAGFKIHNGEFDVHQVSTTASTLTMWVNNTAVDSSDWDILSQGGFAGIFSEQVILTSSSPFIAGDEIHSDLFTSSLALICVGSAASVVLIEGMVDLLALPAGLKLVGYRTSPVIPIRTLADVASTADLVRGDMLSYSEVERQLRIKFLRSDADIAITIAVGDGTNALVTLGSGTTADLWMGQKVLILRGAIYSGVFTIVDVNSPTTFTLATTITSSDAATLVGNTIEIDENLSWKDSTKTDIRFAVSERWAPIEAPSAPTSDLIKSTYVTHFAASAYSDQPILRSTMVSNSLYETNNQDSVMKFDGTSLYRAGLPRWQPQSFLSVDTSTTGKITINNPTIPTTGHSQNRVQLTNLADEGTFVVGDVLVYGLDSGTTYQVISIQEISSVAYIYLDRAITAGTAASTLYRTSVFKYYFRLNAVDANNSVIVSAIAGSDDYAVRLDADAGVRLRLLGLPALDNYDYARLEVEVYRTKSNTQAPFFRLTTIPLSFVSNAGYIDYLDTAADSDLINLDAVSTALKGQELITAISEPLRAKSITSAGNRLILGNIRDYPTIDVQVTKNTDRLLTTDFAGLRTLLKRDDTDSGTSTDMVNRATYEWRNVSGKLSIVAASSTISGSVVTLHVVGHGARAGNWVYLFRATETSTPKQYNTRLAGWFQVASVVGVNDFTINTVVSDTTSPLTANDIDSALFATNKADIPVPVGQDYNYRMINGNAVSSLFTYEFFAFRRLSDAINASMRNTNLTIVPNFVAWVTANAGNDYNSGEIVLKQAKVSTVTMSLTLPTFTSTMSFFAHGTRVLAGEQSSAITKLFPSRLLASFPNFPEIFDAPTVLTDLDSDSAIDVNPADGQEITAVVPFFGFSAFGAAQKSNVVVAFKTNSIYLVDLAAKAAGTAAVQRIESQGRGCTFPNSVTSTRNGIMFANDSGLYRLNTDLTIDYVGRKYEKRFKTQVDKTRADLAFATHNGIQNVYKLSYVKVGDTLPSNVAVYDYVREYERTGQTAFYSLPAGAWSTYDNHPSIGWANLNSESFFASTTGRVFLNRDTGTLSDFRDDSAPISFEMLSRGNDFGDSGIRKMVRTIVMHFIGTNSSGTTLTVGRDLIDNYMATDNFKIVSNVPSTGVGDTGASKVNTLGFMLSIPKAVYFQVKIVNAALDEDLQVVGIDWQVAGLNARGIEQAVQST